MTLRTLREGMAPGAANMERDQELARRLEHGEIGPTVRIYGWAPPAVSIGYNQDEGDFDTAALARAGIDLVRRPTGGRAILHAHEVTYCAVIPLSFGSPRSIYAMINEALLAGIRAMGIAAELNDADQDLRRAYAAPGGIPCFSTSVRSEIRSGGKKLVGSAQRRFGPVVLQHGSFLLGPQHREIARFVRGSGGGTESGIAADLAARTTEAETILGRSVTFDEASGAIASGFERFPLPTPGRTGRPGMEPASAASRAFTGRGG